MPRGESEQMVATIRKARTPNHGFQFDATVRVMQEFSSRRTDARLLLQMHKPECISPELAAMSAR
jgi:hypothetical protein